MFLSTKAAESILSAHTVCVASVYSSVPRSFMVKTIKNTLTRHAAALRFFITTNTGAAVRLADPSYAVLLL